MQTIGIIGGMSWHSTINYYKIINSRVQEALGGHHSARVLIDSLDFDEVRARHRFGHRGSGPRRLGRGDAGGERELPGRRG